MNYHVAQFKESRDQWYKGVNTFRLQYKSLQYFLTQLGYQVVYNPLTDQMHIHTDDKKSFMSLKDAVALHNDMLHNVSDEVFKRFTEKQLIKAWNSRLVEEVKLRRTKKKGVEVSTNFVKLCCEENVESLSTCGESDPSMMTIKLSIKQSQMALLQEASDIAGISVEEWVKLSAMREAMNVINRSKEGV